MTVLCHNWTVQKPCLFVNLNTVTKKCLRERFWRKRVSYSVILLINSNIVCRTTPSSYSQGQDQRNSFFYEMSFDNKLLTWDIFYKLLCHLSLGKYFPSGPRLRDSEWHKLLKKSWENANAHFCCFLPIPSNALLLYFQIFLKFIFLPFS